MSLLHLNKPFFFKPNRKKADSPQTGSGLQIILIPLEELAIDINSGRPGMEGVPGVSGDTFSESQGSYEGTPLVECRFFSFSCILDFACLRSNTCKPSPCHSANVPNIIFW